MIIQCEKCGTKYRLDDSKVGKKGVKVKCTKCQHLFIVRREEPLPQPLKEEPSLKEELGFRFEEEKPAAPPFEKKEREPEGFKTEEWKPEETPFGFKEEEAKEKTHPAGEDLDITFKEERTEEKKPAFEKETLGFEEEERTEKAPPEEQPFKEDFDISFEEERQEKTEGPALEVEKPEKAGPFPGEWKPEGFEEEGRGLKEEARSLTEPVGAGELTAGKGEVPAEDAPSVDADAKTFRERFFEEKARREEAAPGFGKPRWSILIVIFILLYGGSAMLYLLGALDSIKRSLVTAPAELSPLKIESLNGSFVENEKAGRVFAIEGRVKNFSEEPQSIKVVRGTVYDRGGRPIATSEVSPGRLVSSEELKTLPREELLKHFKDISSGTVPPKGTIPVMVVFTDAPEDIAEAALEVIRGRGAVE